MAQCTNCFSGCVSTTSDKCVKYTGASIAFLNINTGDSLESVEKAITDYLTTVLSGVGITPSIDSQYICDIVSQYLPCAECGTPTLVDILVATIRSICTLQNEIENNRQAINDIEASYDVGCLEISPNAGTHIVLEAAITALCQTITDVGEIFNLLETYVKITDIDTYIQNYVNTTSSDSKMYNKMVPYVIYPFYPTAAVMANFGFGGVGTGDWEKIYICNGYNGLTPDLKGRSLIGTTDVGGATPHPDVDTNNGNPTYNLGTTNGKNYIPLSADQIPSHSHVATASVNDPGHGTKIDVYFASHSVNWDEGGAPNHYPAVRIESAISSSQGDPYDGPYETTSAKLAKTGITVSVSNAENEGGQSHPNVHPVYAVYYIMYIP